MRAFLAQIISRVPETRQTFGGSHSRWRGRDARTGDIRSTEYNYLSYIGQKPRQDGNPRTGSRLIRRNNGVNTELKDFFVLIFGLGKWNDESMIPRSGSKTVGRVDHWVMIIRR